MQHYLEKPLCGFDSAQSAKFVAVKKRSARLAFSHGKKASQSILLLVHNNDEEFQHNDDDGERVEISTEDNNSS